MKLKFQTQNRDIHKLRENFPTAAPKNNWWVLILPLLYFSIYLSGLLLHNLSIFYISYLFMAILLIPIFIYIVHEGVHGNVFRSRKANRNILYIFDIIGANSYIFHKRHMQLHHNYCNIVGWDSDIEQSGPLRLHKFGRLSKMHRYQHIYALFLYPLYVGNWMLIRDFKDFFMNPEHMKNLGIKIPSSEKVKLIFFKIVTVGYLIILPSIIYGFWHAIIGFAIFTISASLFALLVL
ncbi:MAG: fatty acid desaturase [Saprospiraceae bacterium]